MIENDSNNLENSINSKGKITVKFLLKCIACLIPLAALIIYTLLCPMYYMDEEYPSWKYKKEVAEGSIGEQYYDTVILGDSGAMSALVPSKISDDSCVSLAVGGATSIEMYYFMKEYLENHEAPKNVVIMFAPFHYWHIDNYKTRTMYFKALSCKDTSELRENAEYCGADSVLFDDCYAYDFSCRAGLPTVYLPAITAAKFVSRYDSNKALYSDLVKAEGFGSFGKEDYCADESYETSYTEVEFGGDVYLIFKYFDKIVELCKENGCKISLLQPALNEATYDNLNADYLKGYYAFVEDFANSHEDVYVERELRRYDNDCFGDVSHLNGKGAEKFSLEIYEILKNQADR